MFASEFGRWTARSVRCRDGFPERAAYQAEQFEQARDLARTASQTDAKNPDVWLLVGKSHFQLGELDQALVAWQSVILTFPGCQTAWWLPCSFFS